MGNGEDVSNGSNVYWDENGNLINTKEGVSESENEIGDKNVDAGLNKDISKVGTVINSINLEPSLLGTARKGRVMLKLKIMGRRNKEMPYAGALRGVMHKGKIEVKYIQIGDGKEDGHAVIPIENLKKANIPYSNTLYGYLIDKNIAFLVIQKELNQVESLKLTKNNHNKVPVWIKIYDLPLEVWSGENLCIITSKLGIPLAFDSYTEEMCLEHKGRNAYARILVERSAEREWKKSIEVTTWVFVLNCAVTQEFNVEYAWYPSRCSHCKVYGHIEKICMAAMSERKIEKELNEKENNKRSKGKGVMDDEGFIEVIKKGGNGGVNSASTSGMKGNGGNKHVQNIHVNYGNTSKGNVNRGNGGKRVDIGRGIMGNG
ncbi:unnamed protein product [Lactuca virosa]|uniref:DUF4283 domain-containing protein n=1 Tax=Lactuca virosa TaxID=75947 RepID=A0AAU9PKZ6_9ASTR|nr:unnamed protein product [Lactuca virosa]